MNDVRIYFAERVIARDPAALRNFAEFTLKYYTERAKSEGLDAKFETVGKILHGPHLKYARVNLLYDSEVTALRLAQEVYAADRVKGALLLSNLRLNGVGAMRDPFEAIDALNSLPAEDFQRNLMRVFAYRTVPGLESRAVAILKSMPRDKVELPLAKAAADGHYQPENGQDPKEFARGIAEKYEANRPTAKYILARFLDNGEAGYASDPRAAFAKFKELADRDYFGEDEPLVAKAYLNGSPRYGVAQDVNLAVKYYIQAAREGNGYAYMFLARAISEGKYQFTKNEAETIKLLKLAAWKDNSEAQVSLGFHAYRTGNKLAADPWFETVLNNPKTPNRYLTAIAKFYLEDADVNQKLKAARYVLKAAKNGDADAQHGIAALERDNLIPEVLKPSFAALRNEASGSRPKRPLDNGPGQPQPKAARTAGDEGQAGPSSQVPEAGAEAVDRHSSSGGPDPMQVVPNS
jgi:TPR repeat protein